MNRFQIAALVEEEANEAVHQCLAQLSVTQMRRMHPVRFAELLALSIVGGVRQTLDVKPVPTPWRRRANND